MDCSELSVPRTIMPKGSWAGLDWAGDTLNGKIKGRIVGGLLGWQSKWGHYKRLHGKPLPDAGPRTHTSQY